MESNLNSYLFGNLLSGSLELKYSSDVEIISILGGSSVLDKVKIWNRIGESYPEGSESSFIEQLVASLGLNDIEITISENHKSLTAFFSLPEGLPIKEIMWKGGEARTIAFFKYLFKCGDYIQFFAVDSLNLLSILSGEGTLRLK
jgi:hypothetical protein